MSAASPPNCGCRRRRTTTGACSRCRRTSTRSGDRADTVDVLARPTRNWIQEERRKTLGDWVAFCLECGFTVRFFEELEGDLPAACPQCHGELRHRCQSCRALIPSAFAIECEECAAPLRPPRLFGGPIRRPGR